MTTGLFSLNGKIALVTGGSRGIGRAAALAFARAGADVAVCGRSRDDLDGAVKDIEDAGQRGLAVVANLSRVENIEAVTDQIMDEWGGLDILVNNAGRSPAYADCLHTEERLWDAVMNLNLKSLYFLSQAAARIMKSRGGGSIINVSSIAGEKPAPFLGVYSISKAAILSVTQSMALELAPYNIRVNAIAPGYVATRLLTDLWAHLPPDQQAAARAAMSSQVPMGRIAETEEIVGGMVFLASEASSYMTGETMRIDGGTLLSGPQSSSEAV